MSKSYLNEFNDYQRIMFIEALENLVASKSELLKSQPADDSPMIIIPGDSRLDEVQTMISMLKDLPQLEADEPGILHGLCS